MIKYTIKIDENGQLYGTEQKKDKIKNLSEKDVVKKIYRIPKYSTKTILRHRKGREERSELHIIGPSKEWNVTIYDDHKKILERLEEVHKELSSKKKFAVGLTASTALAGFAAFAVIRLCNNAGVYVDPEKYDKISEEDALENTKALEVIDEDMIAQYDDGTLIKVDQDYLASNNINEGYKIELDNNSLYSKGIEERNEPYKDSVVARGNKWAISDQLLYDILSQEYGGEDDKNNICHVVFSSWEDHVLQSYNDEKGYDEKIVLTSHPEKYEKILEDRSNEDKPNAVDQTISREELKNPDTSLGVACSILQFTAKYYDGNLPLAVQAYNNGVGTVDEIIKTTAQSMGLTYADVVADKDSVVWLKYRDIGQKSDPNYFYNVAKHVSNPTDNTNTYSIQYRDKQGNLQSSDYTFINQGLMTAYNETNDEENVKGR